MGLKAVSGADNLNSKLNKPNKGDLRNFGLFRSGLEDRDEKLRVAVSS